MSDSLIDRTIGFQLGSVEETEVAFSTPLGEGRRLDPQVRAIRMGVPFAR